MKYLTHSKDRYQRIALIALIVFVTLYLLSFALFLYYEWNKKVTEIMVKDGAGVIFYSSTGRMIYRKLFKRDRG
jgi:polyferredoxin